MINQIKYIINNNGGASYYDHHQEDVPVYENGIKYAACGLYLENMKSLSPRVKKYILERALYGVQAQDNGQDVNPKEYPNPFTFVGLYNCDWKTGIYGEEQDKMFDAAVIIAESVLKCIIRDAELEEESYKQVQDVIENAHKAPASFGGVIDIGNYCPWIKPVIEHNVIREQSSDNIIKAVVFKNAKGEYQCQVVPKRHDSFEAWCSIPEEVSEYPGFIFRHKAAFLAGFTSHDSAIRCAYVAVKHS